MASWFRLETTLPDHPKLIKLARITGISQMEALGQIVTLFSRVSDCSPDGDISSYDQDDIEIMARWDGERGSFFRALIDVKFIDIEGEFMGIHGWMERAERHKAALRKRKQREKGKEANVTGQSLDSHGTGRDNGVTVTEDVTGRDETRRDETKNKPMSSQGRTRRSYSEDVNKVLDHYKLYHPKGPGSRPGDKEKKAIIARLKEGFPVEELTEAIDGMHKTPHNLGQNERNTQYLDLELCMRNSANVNRFIKNNSIHRGSPLSKEVQSTINAAKEFLEE